MALAASLSLPMAARLSAVASSARRVSASVARLPKPPPSRAALSFARRDRGARLRDVSQRASDGDGASDDDAPAEGDGLSSSFAEELERRRSANTSGGGGGEEREAWGDKWGPAGGGDDLGDAPRFAKDDGARGVETEQLRRSRALQNEGLEGFPTRAGELLKLGFVSFISFGPLIAVFSVLFVGTYVLLGSDFIHGGDAYGGAPAYVPPEVLLAEPTVDRMVPMYDPTPYGQ